MSSPLRPPRRVWLGWVCGALLLGFAAFNLLAWQQAWAMTLYAPSGAPPLMIEAMSARDKVRAALLGLGVARPENRATPRDVGLAYETRRLDLPGGAVETWIVERSGAADVILLFPGYASSKDSLLLLAREFAARGLTVVLADFRGAGGSTGADTTLGVREAEDVAAVYADARAHWPGWPAILYGVSMGSAAVLHAVAAHGIAPEAVILESPFDSLLNTVAARFRAFGLPATPTAQALVFWGGVQHRQNGLAFRPADDARAVGCPALVLHGQRDPRATTAQSRAVYDRLGGEKRFAEIPGAGHDLLLVTAPLGWQGAVDPFLDVLASRP